MNYARGWILATTLAAVICAWQTRAEVVDIGPISPGAAQYYGQFHRYQDSSYSQDGVNFLVPGTFDGGVFAVVGADYGGQANPSTVLSVEYSPPWELEITLPQYVKQTSVQYGTGNGANVTFQLTDGTQFVGINAPA